MTTWQQLRKDDQILDRNGDTWNVTSNPAPRPGTTPPQVAVGIAPNSGRLPRTVVVKLADEPVDMAQEPTLTDAIDDPPEPKRVPLAKPVKGAVSMKRDPEPMMEPTEPVGLEQKWHEAMARPLDPDGVLMGTLAPLKPEVIATETTEEAQAKVLPVILNTVELRSHLYLAHDYELVGLAQGAENVVAMREHHRQSHRMGQFKPDRVHTHEGDK